MVSPAVDPLPPQLVAGAQMRFPEESKRIPKHPTPDTTLAQVLLTQGPNLTFRMITMNMKANSLSPQDNMLLIYVHYSKLI